MTPSDDDDQDSGGEDILAAEYVLGVLPLDERQAVASRTEADPAFARLVDAWEVRLSPLAGAFYPVAPPAAVKASLDRRLFAGAAPAGPGLLGRLAFWRGLALASLAALLLVLVLPFLQPAPTGPIEGRLVASLAGDGSDVRYLAVYDAAAGQISLSHVTGEAGTNNDFELWVIEEGQAPVSLGLIQSGARVQITVTPAQQALIASGALFAISLEPEGGSPTGQPTGPVVAVGDLREI